MNCPNCGLELEETNWGNYFCRNCGKSGIGQEESDVEDPSYIN